MEIDCRVHKTNDTGDKDWGWEELRLNAQRYALVEPYYIQLIGEDTVRVLIEFYSKFCTKYEYGVNLFVAAIVDDYYNDFGLLVVGNGDEAIYTDYCELLEMDMVSGKYEAECLANKIIRRVPQKMEVGYRWIY